MRQRTCKWEESRACAICSSHLPSIRAHTSRDGETITPETSFDAPQYPLCLKSRTQLAPLVVLSIVILPQCSRYFVPIIRFRINDEGLFLPVLEQSTAKT